MKKKTICGFTASYALQRFLDKQTGSTLVVNHVARQPVELLSTALHCLPPSETTSCVYIAVYVEAEPTGHIQM